MNHSYDLNFKSFLEKLINVAVGASNVQAELFIDRLESN